MINFTVRLYCGDMYKRICRGSKVVCLKGIDLKSRYDDHELDITINTSNIIIWYSKLLISYSLPLIEVIIDAEGLSLNLICHYHWYLSEGTAIVMNHRLISNAMKDGWFGRIWKPYVLHSEDNDDYATYT